jgi:putative oxidoreductase
LREDQSAALLFFRVTVGILFIWNGYNHIFITAPFSDAMAKEGVPLPQLVAYATIVIEMGGGLAILLGVFTRTIAVLFAIYVIVATIIVHHFWTMDGAAFGANKLQATKNLTLIGGFMLLAAFGPGRYAIDALLSRRKPALSVA